MAYYCDHYYLVARFGECTKVIASSDRPILPSFMPSMYWTLLVRGYFLRVKPYDKNPLGAAYVNRKGTIRGYL